MLDKNATNHGFECLHCGAAVAPASQTARNHCPYCLWSRHVDSDRPGDRASSCGGAMQPIQSSQRHGQWSVLHRCQTCGQERANKLASDDDGDLVIQLTAPQAR